MWYLMIVTSLFNITHIFIQFCIILFTSTETRDNLTTWSVDDDC